jgi:hypothetical protein
MLEQFVELEHNLGDNQVSGRYQKSTLSALS